MTVPINAIVEEAIRYEHNLAALYQALSSLFSDDADLWWELSLSEEEHAMLLETGRKLFNEEFSRDTLPADLEGLRRSNESLESILHDFELVAEAGDSTARTRKFSTTVKDGFLDIGFTHRTGLPSISGIEVERLP